jgi:hypothetical protein
LIKIHSLKPRLLPVAPLSSDMVSIKIDVVSRADGQLWPLNDESKEWKGTKSVNPEE